MAERKSQQKYYPPDWDPSKGSLNTFHGQHALRERASKLHLGILVVRIEMPFNVWCHGCKNHIGRGVRYNAEKRQVGTYFTSKIWAFRMKCHLCDNYMEIQTDPKGRDYVCTSGLTRKTETYTAQDAESHELMDAEEKQKLESDPFYKLEHQNEDKSKAEQVTDLLQQMHSVQNLLFQDDFANSQIARRRMREYKTELRTDKKRMKSKGIDMPLPLQATPEDIAAAAAVRFGTQLTAEQKLEKARKQTLQSSIFAKGNKSTEKGLSEKKAVIAKAELVTANVFNEVDVKPTKPHFGIVNESTSVQDSKTLVKITPKRKVASEPKVEQIDEDEVKPDLNSSSLSILSHYSDDE